MLGEPTTAHLGVSPDRWGPNLDLSVAVTSGAGVDENWSEPMQSGFGKRSGSAITPNRLSSTK